MADDSDMERVWKLVEKVRFCMLSTLEGEDIRARPMTAHLDRDDHVIYFLSDAASPKDEDIAKNPSVGLAFADVDDQNYVSISGRAQIINDREKIAELWSTPARAWWDSPDDPSIRILKVTARDAHYWDGPGSAASYIKLLSAAAAGGRPDVGDEGRVSM